MSCSASVILCSSSEPVSSSMGYGACVTFVLIGSNDDELDPVEDSRCGDENVC